MKALRRTASVVLAATIWLGIGTLAFAFTPIKVTPALPPGWTDRAHQTSESYSLRLYGPDPGDMTESGASVIVEQPPVRTTASTIEELFEVTDPVGWGPESNGETEVHTRDVVDFHGCQAGHIAATGRSVLPDAFTGDAYSVEEVEISWWLVPLAGGNALFTARAAVEADALPTPALSADDVTWLKNMYAEALSVVDQLEIEWGQACGGGVTTVPEEAPGEVPEEIPAEEAAPPWTTIVGGAAAVAALAIALAGLRASKTAKQEAVDPTRPIGNVLQLSADQLTLPVGGSAQLVVQVWEVLGSGEVRPAQGAVVSLVPPAGVQASPLQGPSPLSVQLWLSGALPPGGGLAVRAEAATGATQSVVSLVAEAPSQLVLSVPAGAVLRPTGHHSVWVRAELRPAPSLQADPGFDPVAARASIQFAQPGSGEWLGVGQAQDTPVGKDAAVAVSSPDPTRDLEPPQSVVVRARAFLGQTPVEGSVTIPVERPPRIDIRPDTIEYTAGSGASTEVLVWVDHPGGGEWRFSTAWREGERPLATVEMSQRTASTAVVTLTEAAADLPESDRAVEASTLVITAATDGWGAIRRQLNVIVSREGLFVVATGRHPDGTFHLDATGAGDQTAIDVRVYTRDATGTVRVDPGRSAGVEWEPAGEEGTPGRTALGFPEFSCRPAGTRPGNPPSATFRLQFARKLPTSGGTLSASLRASVPGADAPEYTRLVPLTLVGVDAAPFSPAWQEELERCRRVIDEYAPRDQRTLLHQKLAERGPKVGAEELYEFRHRVWALAENALRAEAADYLTQAWRIDQIESVLDWASWCGDIAFRVVSGRLMGTGAALAAGMLKPTLVSAVQVYLDGGSVEDWAWQQVSALPGLLEARVTDPDYLERLPGTSRTRAWAIFVGYTFCKEWYLDPEHRITEAATRTAAQLRDEALVHFLGQAVGRTGTPAPRPDAGDQLAGPKPDSQPAAKPDAHRADAPEAVRTPDAEASSRRPDAESAARKPDADPAARTPDAQPAEPGVRQAARSRADSAAERIAGDVETGTGVRRSTAEQIMRDPDAMRELKRNHPEQWDDFHRTRSEIYAEHDSDLGSWVERNVAEAKGRTVEVRTVGTPDGVDRDYRVGYTETGPGGTERFIELPKEKWRTESERIFAQRTGGPSDPEGAGRWAKDHQQLGTDQYHAEASVDLADQGTVWDAESGTWKKTQLTPNVDLVKQGRSTLADPEGLGDTYRTKVAEACHEGHLLDAYRQASKASDTLQAVQDGYRRQGYQVPDPPEPVRRGLDTIRQVDQGNLDPADAEARLRDLGLGGLDDFMEKVSGQFGKLGSVRR